MTLSTEQEVLLERCGASLSRPIETSRLCGMPLDELKQHLINPESPVYQAYFKGLELTKLALRESTIAIARQGASAAQTLAYAILKDLETEIDD
jgi:hypothetical protein